MKSVNSKHTELLKDEHDNAIQLLAYGTWCDYLLPLLLALWLVRSGSGQSGRSVRPGWPSATLDSDTTLVQLVLCHV